MYLDVPPCSREFLPYYAHIILAHSLCTLCAPLWPTDHACAYLVPSIHGQRTSAYIYIV